MQNYDILLIHAPAVYDFRRKPLFPDALARSVEGVKLVNHEQI